MNITLNEHQEHYITASLASGDFSDASDVIQDALLLHEAYRNKMLEELRKEIAKGIDGPASKRSVDDIIKDRLQVLKK